MKYIITESKLESVIFNYLDDIFPIDEINYSHPYEYDDDGTEGEDENRIEYYIGDYNDGETCFKWYDCEYFIKGSPAQDICPTVSIEYPYEKTLNGYFGETWQEPFKKWFIKNFDLPVKTLIWQDQ